MSLENSESLFQPYDPDNVADPYPMYARMREEQPLYRWEEGHCWVATRYDDVSSLLKDSRFTPDTREWNYYQGDEKLPEEVRRYNAKGLFQLDASGHARVRKLISPVFTPRRAAAREPLIQQVVDELLEQAGAAERDVIDLVPTLAEPMPMQVIRRILGIPAEHDEAFRSWGQKTILLTFPGMIGPEEYERVAQQLPAGYALLREAIAQRRAEPSDDLLSALIHARDEDDRLDEEELISLVSGLIIAGSETTVHLVCRCVINLMERPEVQAEVRADLERLPAFIEEVLRCDNFGVGGMPRYALEDVEIRGTMVPKGEMIMCIIGAAMHDPSVYPQPKSFDMDRNSVPNISFGRGPHFCLGAHLARSEAKTALTTLLTRFPVLEAAGEYAYTPHPIIRSISTLPVRLRPES